MENPMTIKTLGVIAIVTAALSSPVFAQDAFVEGTAAQKPVHALRHYRGTYNQVQAPAYIGPRGYEGDDAPIDRSRPGGLDADFRPAGT
jgi:hypothetical protein